MFFLIIIFYVGAKEVVVILIERFHSHGQYLFKCMGTKQIVYVRKEFNSDRICLEHQHGHCFIVLEYQNAWPPSRFVFLIFQSLNDDSLV